MSLRNYIAGLGLVIGLSAADAAAQSAQAVTVVPVGSGSAASASTAAKPGAKKKSAVRPLQALQELVSGTITDYTSFKAQVNTALTAVQEQFATQAADYASLKSQLEQWEQGPESMQLLYKALQPSLDAVATLKTDFDGRCAGYVGFVQEMDKTLAGRLDNINTLSASEQATLRGEVLKLVQANAAKANELFTACTAAEASYTARKELLEQTVAANLTETEGQKQGRIDDSFSQYLSLTPFLGLSNYGKTAGAELCYGKSFQACINGGSIFGEGVTESSKTPGTPSTESVGHGYQQTTSLDESVKETLNKQAFAGVGIKFPLAKGENGSLQLGAVVNGYQGTMETETTKTRKAQLQTRTAANVGPELSASKVDLASETSRSYGGALTIDLCYGPVCVQGHAGGNFTTAKSVAGARIGYKF
ncbi:hypothetical protein HYX14_06290 [Candidatus Woesearchaeota archaeon]|nr:hypothetical protein [Candidatus Woesearchaeota archaeon]